MPRPALAVVAATALLVAAFATAVRAEDPDAGYWAVTYSGCNATCTLVGAESGTVACLSKANNSVVESASCANNGTAPAPSQPCRLSTCGAWDASEWGSCSVLCGGGAQERDVECVLSDGTAIASSRCNATTLPATSQACNNQPCTSWVVGSYGNCSQPCDTGIRTRNVTCLHSYANGTQEPAADSGCPFGTKPNVSESCSQAACTYEWVAGAFSNCSLSPMGTIQSRRVTCRNALTTAVASDAMCVASQRPVGDIACYTSGALAPTPSGWACLGSVLFAVAVLFSGG